MTYFNYHATAKKLIKSNKLLKFCFVDNYKGISPALLLFFDDVTHPIMPIRKHRWEEYIKLIK